VLVKKRNKDRGITIAVIAVPAEVAQAVVNTAVAAGLKAILNFSPGTLKVPPDVKLKSVDLTVSLESLSFFLAQGEGPAVRAAMRAEPPREGDAPRLFKKKTRRDQKTTTVGEITSFPH
jgi:CoA binding domain